MVLLLELERNGVSNLGSDIRRAVQKLTGPADNDLVISRDGGGRRSGTWEGAVGRGNRLAIGNSHRACNSCDTCGGSRGSGSSSGRYSPSGILECLELIAGVNGKDHPLLTVAGLTAEYPNWIRILHGELSGGKWAVSVRVWDRDTGPKNELSGHVFFNF